MYTYIRSIYHVYGNILIEVLLYSGIEGSVDHNCFVLLQVLAKLKGLNWREIKKLGDLQSALNATLEDMVAIATASLHQSPYTQEEIAGILGISVAELKDTSLSERTRDGTVTLIIIIIIIIIIVHVILTSSIII